MNPTKTFDLTHGTEPGIGGIYQHGLFIDRNGTGPQPEYDEDGEALDCAACDEPLTLGFCTNPACDL